MKYEDYLKDAHKAIEDAFKEIIHEAEKPEETPHWQNFNSKPWYTDLDNDPEGQERLLGDRQ